MRRSSPLGVRNDLSRDRSEVLAVRNIQLDLGWETPKYCRWLKITDHNKLQMLDNVIYLYTYMYILICIYLYAYTYMYIHTIYIYVYIIYIYIHILIYIYIYAYSLNYFKKHILRLTIYIYVYYPFLANIQHIGF